MRPRIALFGIYHESNTFIEKATTLDDFKKGHWLKGQNILDEYRQAFHEIGGMINELEKHPVEVLPLTFAEATPGGVITDEAYQALLHQMTDALAGVLPVDGCLVALHGAAVSEQERDMDGHWLSVIRKLVGASVPIIGTIDPHANVSNRMIESTDALIAYRTNPHLDQRETGTTAAALLMRTVRGEAAPSQRLCPSPVAISIEQQHTGSEPCKSLYDFCDRLLHDKKLLHLGINLGFPYADVEEMGTSFILIWDKGKEAVDSVCREVTTYMKVNKDSFVGVKKNINELLPVLPKCEKPVLLLDMGDNIGGGGPGNSLHLLEAFEKPGSLKTFFCICQPQAVSYLVQKNSTGFAELSLRDLDDKIFNVTARLCTLADGGFSENNPRHGGQVHYDMGRIAIVETANGNTILLMSNRIPPFSLQQLTSFGIDPSRFECIVAKGVIAPIAAYSPVCKTIFQVDTPGVTQANMTAFNYRHRRKPLYPFENIVE